MMSSCIHISELQKRRAQETEPYFEFLRVAAMSAGLYVLPAEGSDQQVPHQEDELYFVIRGKARVRIALEEHAVREGSVIFVPQGVPHRFYEITEELVVLVLFASAETLI